MRPAASLLGIGLVLIAHAAHAACPAPIGLADVSQPTTVVGVDVPCTEQGLTAALTAGGVVTFACGPGPVTLPITSAKAITQDTVLDGGGLVTLDGGHGSRILSVPSSFELGTPRLTVQRIRFVRGNSSAASGEDTARGGGAIWVRGGSLRVVATEFVDNRGPATGQGVAAELERDARERAVRCAGCPVQCSDHDRGFRARRVAGQRRTDADDRAGGDVAGIDSTRRMSGHGPTRPATRHGGLHRGRRRKAPGTHEHAHRRRAGRNARVAPPSHASRKGSGSFVNFSRRKS